MKTETKISLFPTERFSSSPSRGINKLHEDLRESLGWSYAEMAAQMEYNFTGERVRLHYKFDRDNPLHIARLCEIHHMPTFACEDLIQGKVHAELKNRLRAWGWTYKELARKVWPGINQEYLESMIDRLQKFFETNIWDGWLIARQREIWKLPTMKSSLFLNPKAIEDMRISRQMLLQFGKEGA